MPQHLLLDALPAAVELVPYQGHHMKGIHHGGDGVDRFDRGDLDPVPERRGLGFEPRHRSSASSGPRPRPEGVMGRFWSLSGSGR